MKNCCDRGLLVYVLIQFILSSAETDFNFRRKNIRAKKTTLFLLSACMYTVHIIEIIIIIIIMEVFNVSVIQIYTLNHCLLAYKI